MANLMACPLMAWCLCIGALASEPSCSTDSPGTCKDSTGLLQSKVQIQMHNNQGYDNADNSDVFVGDTEACSWTLAASATQASPVVIGCPHLSGTQYGLAANCPLFDSAADCQQICKSQVTGCNAINYKPSNRNCCFKKCSNPNIPELRPGTGYDAWTCRAQARYVLGAAGQNGCPSGYHNILAVSACQAAAQALGLGDETSIILPSLVYDLRPKGCFKWLGNGFAYLNRNTGVPANPTSGGAPICEALPSGTYTIQQKVNMRYVDAHESGPDYSVVTRPEQGNDSQKWVITHLSNGEHTIQQKVNMRYVDAHESGSDYSVVTRPRQGNDSQKWVITHLSNGEYTIQHKANFRYMDAHESGSDYSVVTRPEQGNDSQKWVITPAQAELLEEEHKVEGSFLDADELALPDLTQDA